jgi:hypothetical protein
MAQLVEWTWRRVEEIASRRVLVALLALFLVFSAVLFPMHKKKYGEEAVTLDGRPFGFSATEAETALAKFNEAELVAYGEQELITDLAFPIIYSLMSAVALVLLAKAVRVPRPLVLLPFVSALADYTENFSIALMILRELGDRPLGVLATIGSIGSRVKHLGLYSLTLLLVWFAAAALRRRWLAPRVATSN